MVPWLRGSEAALGDEDGGDGIDRGGKVARWALADPKDEISKMPWTLRAAMGMNSILTIIEEHDEDWCRRHLMWLRM